MSALANDGWIPLEEEEDATVLSDDEGWEDVPDDTVSSTDDNGWEDVPDDKQQVVFESDGWTELPTEKEEQLKEATKDNSYITFEDVKDTVVGAMMSVPSAVATATKGVTEYFADERTPEEQRVGEVVAKSEQLSGTSSIRYMMTNSFKDDDVRKEESTERAIKFLMDEGTIKNYSIKDRKVMLNDGRVVDLESSFVDSMVASKYETSMSMILGLTFPMYAKAIKPLQGVSNIVSASAGSATGGAYGAVQDKIANAKFFGESLGNEEIATAAIDAGYDDLFFGGVIESLMYAGKKTGGKILDVAKSVKDKVFGGNYGEAFSILRKNSSLDDNEFESLMDTASLFWNEKRLDINTDAGRKQAIKWMSQYDTSLYTYVEKANSPEAISQVTKNMVQRTSILKSSVRKGDTNAIRDLDTLRKQAGDNYNQMVDNLNKASEFSSVNTEKLTGNLTNTMRVLMQMEGEFNDSTLRTLNTFRNSADGLTNLGSIARLYRTYNSLLRGINLSSASEGSRRALLQGKQDIKDFLYSSIDSMQFATPKEKTKLKKSFENANNGYRVAMSAIDTDLYDAVVSKRGNISSNLLDSLIASAKKGYLGVDLDETSKILNVMPVDKSTKVENAIIKKIIVDNELEREGKISDFKYVSEELSSIKHIFKDSGNVKTIETLNLFKKLWDNDENMLKFIGAKSDEGKLSPAGISKDPRESFKYSSNARIFTQLQKAIPSILKKIPLFGEDLANTAVVRDWKLAAENKNIKDVINTVLSESKDMPDFINRLYQELPKLESTPTGISLKNTLNQYMKLNAELDQAFPQMRERAALDNVIVSNTAESTRRNAEMNGIDTIQQIIPEDLFLRNASQSIQRADVSSERDKANFLTNMFRLTGSEDRFVYSPQPSGKWKVSIADDDGTTPVGYIDFDNSFSLQTVARQAHAIVNNLPRRVVQETPASVSSVETAASRINSIDGASARIQGNTIILDYANGRGEFTFNNNNIISSYTMGAGQGNNSGSKIYKTLWDAIEGTEHKYRPTNGLTNSNQFRMTANMLQYVAKRNADAPHILLNDVQIGVDASLRNQPLTIENANRIGKSYTEFINTQIIDESGVKITADTTDSQLKEIVAEYGSRQDRRFGIKTARLLRNLARSKTLATTAGLIMLLSNQEDLMSILDSMEMENEPTGL